jgi:hypothetical protein
MKFVFVTCMNYAHVPVPVRAKIKVAARVKSKSKSHCDRRSVGQFVLVPGPQWGP